MTRHPVIAAALAAITLAAPAAAGAFERITRLATPAGFAEIETIHAPGRSLVPTAEALVAVTAPPQTGAGQ